MQATTTSSSVPALPRWPGRLASGEVLQRIGHVASGAILPALLFALWVTAVQRQWLPEQILPPPSLVWQSLTELWASGELQDHLAISASRVAWSLLIGGSAGLLLGFAMGLSRTVRAYVRPTFDVVSQFPVLGWIPLLIIFAGIDEALKISAVSIAVVVPVAVNTLKGIANIPHTLLEVARVYQFSLPQVVHRVVLPAAAPSLFNGLRQAVMQAWLTLVFVELLASSEGIGYLMVWGRQLAQLDLVVVGMLLIGAVGVVLDLLLRWAEAALQTWRRAAF
ncbi:ABC transporter permease [Rhizobacter sp. Root1221]|uniref:ABC transporter permease n=1 Tax=Rhizobacter sp. Root1221 TaxID=1736433 RepID=UPI0006FEDD56|nr:ABC transporter permease [Rhizobacter sp. Root1221]KQV85548.1 sulfonate ABC transporter [Rhizobacter sp. Root1221]